jgi:hypothetical protein
LVIITFDDMSNTGDLFSASIPLPLNSLFKRRGLLTTGKYQRIDMGDEFSVKKI